MNRRNFLTLGGEIMGACLIPGPVARRIRDICVGNSQPLILAPECADVVLYANNTSGRYSLYLGDPNAEPDYPSLREFIENMGFNTNKKDSLREYLLEWRNHDETSDGPVKDAIAELKERLNLPIVDYEQEHWLDTDYEMRESPAAKAFHYLCRLPLDDGRPPSGLELGSLSFVEGDRPGSNLTYVEADGLAAIASLQHRLNALKTGVRIAVNVVDSMDWETTDT